MAPTPLGVSLSTKYTLTGPDGTIATFNDPTDTNFIGYLTEVTGLDSPEVRENAENLSGQDGGVHGNFLFGRRPITLTGMMINLVSGSDRNTKITRLQEATNAMRADAKLEWTPEGGEAVYVKVRRQQPVRITGDWTKNFQVALVAADPRIYSVAESSAEVTLSEPADTAAPTETQYVTTSPDGKFVYALSGAAATPKIFVYKRDEVTGHLKKESEVECEASSKSMACSLDGKFLYVVGNNKVSWFTRNESTGALSAKSTIAAGTEAYDIAVSEKVVAVTNKSEGSFKTYTRNTGTGALTLASTVTTKVPPGTSTLSFAGNRLFVTGPSKWGWWAINETTGIATFNGEVNSSNIVGLTAISETRVFIAKLLGGTATMETVTLTSKGTVSKAETSSEAGLEPSAFITYAHGHGSNVYVCDMSRNRIYQYSGGSRPTQEGYAPTGGAKPVAFAIAKRTLTIAEIEEGKKVLWSGYSANFTGKNVSEYEIPNLGVLLRRWSTNIKVACKNNGDMETYPLIVLKTTETTLSSPSIININTGESINFSESPLEWDEIYIDTLNRTISRFVSGELVSVYSMLNYASSNWFALQPGENEVAFSAYSIVGSGGKMILKWRSAWV